MEKEYILYRHFNSRNTLLYVGISINVFSRIAQHREKSHWFEEVSTITLEKFSNMEELRKAEKKAVQKEKPLHNIKLTKIVDGEIVEYVSCIPFSSNNFDEFYRSLLMEVKNNWDRVGTEILGLSDSKVSRLFTGKQKDFGILLLMAEFMQINFEFKAE